MHFVVILITEVAIMWYNNIGDQLVANLSAACWHDFLLLSRMTLTPIYKRS